MDEKRKKPALRFAGFDDDWEQRKWIDTVDISTEMVDPSSGKYDDMPHIAPGNIESFTGRILDNVKTVKEELLISGKFRFRSGDVVYGKINPQLGKYFYAGVDGLTSADAYVFNGKNGITQAFLFLVLQTEDFFKYSVSVSKRSGMPKINRDELNAYDYFAPNKEEQIKIGKYFLHLDHLITLHQRKLDKMKNFKKAMLEKMFPKNDEKIPEVRFAGFTDDWEHRKLGDIAPLRGGFAFKSSEYVSEGVPIVRISNILSDGSVGADFAYYSEQGDDSAYLLSDGAVLLAMSGATTGKVSILRTEKAYKYYQNQRVGYFVPTSECDYGFVSIITRSQYFSEQLNSVLVAGAQPNVSAKDIDAFEFMVPVFKDEQNRLGQYFNNLDRLITLHQRQLEKLKNIKKSMLEKMFV